MNKPLISVIVPIYQVEPYIRKALDCIVDQTYENLQIILIDDGSLDNSGKICDEYAKKDKRITVIHKENGGVSSARNAGLDVAKGDWIHFMDPDDWLETDTYEKVIENAAETGADMVFFPQEIIEGKRKTYGSTLKLIDIRIPHCFRHLDEFDTFLSYASDGTVCMCLISMDVIKSGIRFCDSLTLNEDYTFRLDAYRYIRSFSYLPDILYHCRKREGSATRKKDWKVHFQDMRKAYRIQREIINKTGYPPNAIIAVNTNYLMLMYSLLDNSVFGNSALSYQRKKEIANSFLHSNIYLECKNAYDSRVVRSALKMILSCKNPGIFHLILVHWLSRIKNCLKAIRYS